MYCNYNACPTLRSMVLHNLRFSQNTPFLPLAQIPDVHVVFKSRRLWLVLLFGFAQRLSLGGRFVDKCAAPKNNAGSDADDAFRRHTSPNARGAAYYFGFALRLSFGGRSLKQRGAPFPCQLAYTANKAAIMLALPIGTGISEKRLT